MTTQLQVDLSLPSLSCVQGEKFDVAVSVVNLGQSAVNLVKDAQSSPLIYLLDYLGKDPQQEEAEKTVESLRVSKSIFTTANFGGLWDSTYESRTQDAEAGGAIYFNDDLTAYLVSPLLPGRYRIRAMYRVGKVTSYSEPLAFEVVVPRPKTFHQLVSPIDGFTSGIYDHQIGVDSWVLFQQMSQTDLPQTSVAHRRSSLNGPVTDLALACSLQDGAWGQWFGCLCGKTFSAAFYSNDIEIGDGLVVELSLLDPRLARPAFQSADQSALFTICGMRDGRSVVQLVRCEEEKATLLSESALSAVPVERALVRYVQGVAGDFLCLLWSEQHQGHHFLMTANLDCHGRGLVSAIEKVCDSATAFLCFELLCFDGEEVGFVNALTGTGQPNSDLTYLRVPINPSDLTFETHTLQTPDVPLCHWAIASAEEGAMGIVAASADAVFYTDADSPIFWVTLAKDLDHPAHLTLEAAIRRSPLVSYFDASRGRVYQKVKDRMLFGDHDTEFDLESPLDDFMA